ncbi:MAG: protein kinase, partial [Ktedonobacteraceae bacterium]
MSDEEKLVSHYRLKTLLRRDGFGAVYLAEDTRDQKETILRVIDLDQKTLAAITGRVRTRSQRDHPLIEQIRQRMKRISELKHSHILPVNKFGEEHIQGNNDIIFYMASPLEKASLLSYWSEHTSSAELISLEIVADLLVQAAGALLLVHKRGLVHQYVRLSSFMLRSSTRGRKHLHLLLTDFWFADISAAILEDGQMAQALSVHLAPEQLSGGTIAAASDQYALAVLAYELLLGHRLSGVDLSLKLYETFVRQRATEISESELIIARNIDLVLGRALSEHPAARFQNIEEFALTFLAASRGETIDLVSDATIKLPSQRKQTATVVEAAAGALLAGELIEDLTATQETATISSDSTAGLLAAAQIDEEKTHLQHGHSLHKTVLTSEGMEAVALEQSATATDVTLASEASTTTPVAGAIAGAAGFVAGLAVGEALGEAAFFEQQTQIAGASTAQSGDIANEQTQIAGASTAQSGDIANEQTQIAGASTAQSSDIANEQTQIAGASTAQSGAIADNQTQVMPSSAATSTASDIADENTLILGSGALAAGAVAAAALLASEANTGAIIQSGAAASANMADESTRILTHAASETPLLASEANTGATLQPGAPTLRASEADTNDITQPSITGALPTSGPALEETQFATSAAALAAAGLAGATLAAGGTQQAGLAGAALAAGGTQQAGLAGATLAASGTQQAGLAGAALAAGGTQQAGLARATLAASGTQQTSGGMIGAAGSGLAATSGGMARRRRRPLLVASLIVLTLVLVGGTVFAAFAMFGVVNQSSATVTLTLQGHTIQTSYLVTAMASTTNTSQGQVQARTLSSTISQSKSGQASGFFLGVQASGFITFRNTSTGCGCPVIIPAGTTLISANGVRVVTDTIAS